MRSLVAAVALLLAFAAPASAADRCVAAPGTAAIEQYCETVPSATGDSPDDPANGAIPVPRRTAAEVRDALGDGAGATLGIPAARPPARTKAHRGAPDHTAGAKRRAPVATDDNPLTAVVSAAGTGAEVGRTLAYALLAMTLLLVAVGWLRFRRSDT